MQHQGLREHGKFGRSKLIFAVMTDDEVLEQCLQLIRKTLDLSNLGLEHFQFDNHVTEQLATAGVGKRPLVAELVDFADVMQKSPSYQQVAIDLGIIPGKQIAGAKKGNYVIQQAADIGVVQSLGRRRIAIGGGNFGICNERLQQCFEVRVAN